MDKIKITDKIKIKDKNIRTKAKSIIM